MYCEKCGLNEEGTRFCKTCGSKLMSEVSYQGLRFSRGEQEGFDKLYQLTYKAILGEVRVFIEESDAEDCVQAVFIKLINNIGSFDSNRASFNTWFQTLRKNEIITFNTKLQKSNTYKAKDSDVSDLILENIETTDLSSIPGEELEKEECKRLVLNMLQEVPAEQSQCIIRFYIDGYKQKDIAKELNIPEGTVKSRLSQGKSALKEVVKSYENNGVVLRSASPFVFFLSLVENAELQSFDLKEFGQFSLGSNVIRGEELVSLCKEKGIDNISKVILTNLSGEVAPIGVSTTAKLGITKILAAVSIVAVVGVGTVTMLPDKVVMEEPKEAVIEEPKEAVIEEIPMIEAELDSNELTISEYREILQVYQDVLFKEGLSKEPNKAAELISQRLEKYEPNGMYEFNAWGDTQLYYGLFDLNGDQELEMVITTVDPLKLTGTYDDFIMDSIWTCSNNEVKHLVDRTWGQIQMYDDGNIVVYYAGVDFPEQVWMNYSSIDGRYNLEKVIIKEYDNEYTVSYDKINYEFCDEDVLVSGNFYNVMDIQWYQFMGIDQEDRIIE